VTHCPVNTAGVSLEKFLENLRGDLPRVQESFSYFQGRLGDWARLIWELVEFNLDNHFFNPYGVELAK